jgi:hypothetical protein
MAARQVIHTPQTLVPAGAGAAQQRPDDHQPAAGGRGWAVAAGKAGGSVPVMLIVAVR